MRSQPNLAATAAAAERDRIFSIVEHPEARDRHGAALALARIPGMTADQAGAVLATLPKQSGPAAGNDQFARYLASLGVTPAALAESRVEGVY